MLFKSLMLSFALVPAVMAAGPLDPYVGLWTGTGTGGGQELDITAAVKKGAGAPGGTYNARAANGAAYAGSFRSVRESEACYKIYISNSGKPALNLEVSACADENGGVEIKSVMGNGSLVPSDNFAKCRFRFSSFMGQVYGELSKKGGFGQPAAKKPAGQSAPGGGVKKERPQGKKNNQNSLSCRVSGAENSPLADLKISAVIVSNDELANLTVTALSDGQLLAFQKEVKGDTAYKSVIPSRKNTVSFDFTGKGRDPLAYALYLPSDLLSSNSFKADLTAARAEEGRVLEVKTAECAVKLADGYRFPLKY